jgi:hypothetical protein
MILTKAEFMANLIIYLIINAQTIHWLQISSPQVSSQYQESIKPQVLSL